MPSPGRRFRDALLNTPLLQVVGTVHSYALRLAEASGFKVGYFSGAGFANTAFGLPDLAMTTQTEVCQELSKMTGSSDLPILVDADTGWGSSLNVARTVKELERFGAAGIHLEDQTESKRCGHRSGKRIISVEAMQERLKAAVDARRDPDFFMIARTDALASEPIEQVKERALRYQETGVDALFLEAVTDLEQYRLFSESLSIPVLANMTEFGKTPLQTVEALQRVGVKIALYPLGAFRMMNAAALLFYETLAKEGTQLSLLAQMETREALYTRLRYVDFEQKQDHEYGR